MGNEIRAEVLAAIAEIKKSDNGDDSRIDTKNEYNSLWNYYQEHQQEFETTENAQEKNLILNLLDEAKNFLKNLAESGKDVPSEIESTDNDKPDSLYKSADDCTTQSLIDGTVDDKDDSLDKSADDCTTQSSIDGTVDDKDDSLDKSADDCTTQSLIDRTVDDKDYDYIEVLSKETIEKTGETVDNGNNSSSKKVMINGKICVVKDNGEVFDAITGRRIK
jgi:hypothetical protein